MAKTIGDYNTNFDHEVTSEEERLQLHLTMLYQEMRDICAAARIFRIAEREWTRRVEARETVVYSPVRTALYESLVYRVVLGLSKLFGDSGEYSLQRAAADIGRWAQPCGEELTGALRALRQKRKESELPQMIHTVRNKFFAHLDEESVFSHFRIDPAEVMRYIDCAELEEWLTIMEQLYAAAFHETIHRDAACISEEEVIYTFFWQQNRANDDLPEQRKERRK